MIWIRHNAVFGQVEMDVPKAYRLCMNRNLSAAYIVNPGLRWSKEAETEKGGQP